MRHRMVSFTGIGVCLLLISLSDCLAAWNYYLPVFKPHPGHWSGLGITNLSSVSPATIIVYVYAINGAVLATDTKTIPAGGQDSFMAGGSLWNKGWIKISSNQPLAGLNFLGAYIDKTTDYFLADVPFTDTASKSLLIPHVSQNPTWDTSVYIANTEALSGNVTLTYTNKSGVSSVPHTVFIHGNGMQEVSVKDIAKSTTVYGGYVTISSTRDIVAFALYDNIKAGNYSYAGINAVDMSVPVSGYNYYLPVFKPKPNYWSGLGITNLSSTGNANIATTIFAKNGVILGTENKTISAGGQDSFMVGTSFWNDGWIKITSNQPLAGLNFLGQYKDGTTDYYLADVPFTNIASKSLLLPHVSQNPIWDTTVYIANTESSPGSITLTYRNKSGAASTPYTVSIHGNGTQEIPVSTIGKSTSIYGGSVSISSTREIVAFAIYNNLKTGNYSYAGINAIDISKNTGCVFSISPSSGSFTIGGGSKSVSVIASSSSCAWTASSAQSWVTVSPMSGTGSRSVTVMVSANNGAARSGSVTIAGQTYSISQERASGICGAYVAPNVWKQFDCYNLAAIGKTTGDDPFTPSWRLIGGYWQWGRKGPSSSQWHNTNTSNFAHGPTGSDAGSANSVSISGWDTSYAPDGSWSDTTKTANDPCPSGYRVPTQTQWDGVINNNTQSTVGPWSDTWDTHTNYSAARFFGNDLMLPAAGGRYNGLGALDDRGYYGYYWSSAQHSTTRAWNLDFNSSGTGTYGNHRSYGLSVRCVAE